MPADRSPVLAALRKHVSAKPRGRSFQKPHPFADFSDQYLNRLIKWLHEGRTNEAIAQLVQHYWGEAVELKWAEIVKVISAIREVVFSAEQEDAPPAKEVTGFDALSENSRFIQELKTKIRKWEVVVEASMEKNGGVPDKTLVKRLTGLEALLAEAVSNHSKMALQFEKAKNGGELPEEQRRGGGGQQVTVQVLNNLYARLTDCDQDVQDRTVTLLDKVSSRIQAAAVRRPSRQIAPESQD